MRKMEKNLCQDTEQLPEDGSADSDEEEGDERLDQNTSN